MASSAVPAPAAAPAHHALPGGVPQIGSGIDSITRQRAAAFDVPDKAALVPAETLARSTLDSLLALPDYDEFIARRLRPQLADASIFMPLRFRDLLLAAPGVLHASAQAVPEAAEALGLAARLLFDGAEMHELLQMYRSALLQG